MAEPSVRTVDDLPTEWEVRRLAERLRALLPDLRQRYGLGSVALFGSYVRNEQRPDSDLDVLVRFTKPLSLFDLMDLENELVEFLGVKVDIANRDRLRVRIDRYILQEALPL